VPANVLSNLKCGQIPQSLPEWFRTRAENGRNEKGIHILPIGETVLSSISADILVLSGLSYLTFNFLTDFFVSVLILICSDLIFSFLFSSHLSGLRN